MIDEKTECYYIIVKTFVKICEHTQSEWWVFRRRSIDTFCSSMIKLEQQRADNKIAKITELKEKKIISFTNFSTTNVCN